MAQRVREAAGQYDRVLVVAGGFHIYGLLHPEPPEEHPCKLPPSAQSVYPMRYTMPAADALSGYASGMPAPGYYADVWAALHREGAEKADACAAFCALLGTGERTLLAAYNAQFDLNFLYHFLRPFGRADVLRPPRFLDVLTVYRDRRDYPHKLCDAIAAYGLEDRAVNSHRAVDDARAAALLLSAMAAERDDLDRYVDLFGYSPRYGVSGRRIASVTYRPQSYQRLRPLYEGPETV